MAKKIKLALISCGLGHVQRGFEVSAARWTHALAGDPLIDARLFCGGPFPSGTKVFNFPRNGALATLLKSRSLLQDGCRLEQLSFGIGFISFILQWNPDVIWLQEYSLAHLLTRLRSLFRLHFKIVFCDGAPVGPEQSSEFDFIQHLSPKSWQNALAFGIPEGKMKVLPHCFPLPRQDQSRLSTRQKYGFAESDWIIVCVAAWNRHHKRIDYLINEVSELQGDNIKLLLCGEPEAETAGLKKLAAEKLPNRVTWLTVPPDEVNNVLSAADIFVLPSLNEALGAVMIEAAMCGVPVVAHGHPAARYILQEEEWIEDLSSAGNLARKLAAYRINPPSPEMVRTLQRQANERFGARALAPQFSEMIQSVLYSG